MTVEATLSWHPPAQARELGRELSRADDGVRLPVRADPLGAVVAVEAEVGQGRDRGLARTITPVHGGQRDDILGRVVLEHERARAQHLPGVHRVTRGAAGVGRVLMAAEVARSSRRARVVRGRVRGERRVALVRVAGSGREAPRPQQGAAVVGILVGEGPREVAERAGVGGGGAQQLLARLHRRSGGVHAARAVDAVTDLALGGGGAVAGVRGVGARIDDDAPAVAYECFGARGIGQ